MASRVAALAALLLCGATPALAQATIEWEVLHRFRVITHEAQQAGFLRRALGGGSATEVLADLYGVGREDVLTNLRFGYETAWDAGAAQYSRAWFHEAKRRIRLRLSDAALNRLRRERPSRPKPACAYTLGGQPIGTHPCGDWVEVETVLGTARLSWVAHPGESAQTAPVDEPIELRDLSIASLGDSFSSGEGNPHTRVVLAGDAGAPAQWWDDRCHRSLIAGPALAAARLAIELKHASVTFVSYACSGGEIEHGILGEYEGRETVNQILDRYRMNNRVPEMPYYRGRFLPPQMDQLRALLCEPSMLGCLSRKPLDVLIVGTGGNEIGFGNIVRLILSGAADRNADQIRRDVERELGRLAAEFAKLSGSVAALAPRRTVLVSYLDPTNDEDGQLCGVKPGRPLMSRLWSIFGIGTVSQGEARLASGSILEPLKRLHKAVAGQYGWSFVGDFERKRGVCARPSWFRGFDEAMRLQGYLPSDGPVRGGFPTGVMHPNYFGHRHVGERLAAALRDALGSEQELRVAVR
jgi:hypothetical protein